MEDPTPEAALKRCLDCEHPIRLRYCENCGQKVGPRHRTVFEILGDLWAEMFSLDGRLWRSLGPFLFKPGTLTREYNAGRRTRYIAPPKLYLLCLLLLALVSSAQHLGESFTVADDPVVENDSAPTHAEKAAPTDDGPTTNVEITDLEMIPTDRPFFRRMREALTTFNSGDEVARERLLDAWRDQIPTTIFVLLPLFAFFLRVLLMRRGIYYSEVFVFALHIHAFIYLSFAVTTPFPATWFETLTRLSAFPVFFIGLARAFDLRWYVALPLGTFFLVLYLPTLVIGLLASLLLIAGL